MMLILLTGSMRQNWTKGLFDPGIPSREGPLEFSAQVYLTFSQNFQVNSVSFATPLCPCGGLRLWSVLFGHWFVTFEVRVSIS